MKTKWILAVSLAVVFSAAAWAGEPPIEIVTGDTLWDVSGQIWSKPTEWPKLWAQNPHVHNPHRIWPGDQLFLRATEEPPQAIVREVRLPVERLTPPPPPEPVAEEKPAEAAPAPAEEVVTLRLIESRVQDYLVPGRVKRMGTVGLLAVKNAFVESEEVLVRLADDASAPAPGSLVTLFDDDRLLRHPVTGAPYGYQVHILGHARVLDVNDQVARVRIERSYDYAHAGAGVMPFREPVVAVVPKLITKSVDGVVIAGTRDTLLYSSDEAVFLDRGKADGLEPGVLFESPYPGPPPMRAQGLVVETHKPRARLVVVGVEERSSTLYVLDDRIALEAGSKVRTRAVSP